MNWYEVMEGERKEEINKKWRGQGVEEGVMRTKEEYGVARNKERRGKIKGQ